MLYAKMLHRQMLHGQMMHGQMLHGQMVLGHLSTVKEGSTNLKCPPRYFPWGGGGGGGGVGGGGVLAGGYCLLPNSSETTWNFQTPLSWMVGGSMSMVYVNFHKPICPRNFFVIIDFSMQISQKSLIVLQ